MYEKQAKKESCNEERKKFQNFLKNGDEREVLACDNVFLDACISQTDH